MITKSGFRRALAVTTAAANSFGEENKRAGDPTSTDLGVTKDLASVSLAKPTPEDNTRKESRSQQPTDARRPCRRGTPLHFGPSPRGEEEQHRKHGQLADRRLEITTEKENLKTGKQWHEHRSK